MLKSIRMKIIIFKNVSVTSCNFYSKIFLLSISYYDMKNINTIRKREKIFRLWVYVVCTALLLSFNSYVKIICDTRITQNHKSVFYGKHTIYFLNLKLIPISKFKRINKYNITFYTNQVIR